MRTDCKRILRTDWKGVVVFNAAMNDLSDIPSKLRALREAAGLSVRTLATELGMPSSSSYSHYELRYKRPWLPMDFALQLAEVLERHGVDRHDVLSLAGAADVAAPAVLTGDSELDLVPVYNVAASAGPGALIDWHEEVVERLAFPPGYLRHITSANPKYLAIISVKGRSMEPTLREDDVVMIDTAKRDLSFEGIFVIRDGGQSMLVKRISRASRRGFVMLVSDNRDHPPVERALDDIEVIGKVIWAGVKM